MIPLLRQEANRQEALAHLNYGAVKQNVLVFGLLMANTQMGQ